VVGARQFLSSDARKIPGNLPCLCRVRWEQCLRESPRVTQVEAGNMENDLITERGPDGDAQSPTSFPPSSWPSCRCLFRRRLFPLHLRRRDEDALAVACPRGSPDRRAHPGRPSLSLLDADHAAPRSRRSAGGASVCAPSHDRGWKCVQRYHVGISSAPFLLHFRP